MEGYRLYSEWCLAGCGFVAGWIFFGYISYLVARKRKNVADILETLQYFVDILRGQREKLEKISVSRGRKDQIRIAKIVTDIETSIARFSIGYGKPPEYYQQGRYCIALLRLVALEYDLDAASDAVADFRDAIEEVENS